MFQLFQSRLQMTRGTVLPGQADYIRRTYQERLTQLRQYYSERTMYLRNDHILVRLLTHGLGSLHTDYSAFVYSHSDRTDSMIRHFQFTGAASYGKIWNGEFYGERSWEIIVGDDAYFDMEMAIRDWQSLTPVRVLTHPISDLGLALPNGKTNHVSEGLSVIYINIPMLFLQYRRFIEEQLNQPETDGSERIVSPKLFLYRYVLPNMMSSHVDHVFVNRLLNLFSEQPMTTQIGRSPFFQADSGLQEGSGILGMIDNAQEEILRKITTTNMEFDQALKNIFTVSVDNALDLLIMPDLALTRQVWWSFLLARLKHTKFLLLAEKSANSGKNRIYHNRAIIDLSRLLDSHVLEKTLSAEILESTILEIQETIELAKS